MIQISKNNQIEKDNRKENYIKFKKKIWMYFLYNIAVQDMTIEISNFDGTNITRM